MEKVLTEQETKKIVEAIKKYNAKIVAIQVPEGMKTRVQEIADEIEKLSGTKAVILADPCFGACDVADKKAKDLGCKLILHFGHADLNLKTDLPVIYIEKFSNDEPPKVLLEKISQLPYKRIGLVAAVQYVQQLSPAKKYLEGHGKKVFIGRPKSRAKYDGQILGCDVSAAKAIEKNVDCFVFIGTGRFHPLGLLKATDKPVLQCDTEKQMLVDLSAEKNLLEKRAAIKKAKFAAAEKIGLLVSTKGGQFNKNAFALRKDLERAGKKVWIVAMDRISPEKLMGLKFDVLVNTACPRLSEDLIFENTIINASEIRL